MSELFQSGLERPRYSGSSPEPRSAEGVSVLTGTLENLRLSRPRRLLVLVRDAGPASRSISRYRSEPLRAGARRWGPDRSRCPCAAPTPCASWDA